MAINKRLIRSNDEAASGTSFNTVLYTANGGTLPVTGVGFTPDLVWVKSRVDSQQHILTDSVRGVGNGLLSNLTLSESGVSSNANGKVQSFDSDGFTVNVGTNNLPTNNYTNDTSNGGSYVAWCWKAGGTAVSGTGTNAQNITYSANPDAGFSIVKFSTNGSTSYTATHGLNQAPELVISKVTTVASNWLVYSSSLGINQYMNLDTSAQALTYSNLWNGMSSTHIGGSNAAYGGTNTFVNYCFHSVDGYQKVGSYTGTGAAGNTVTTGFEPRFLLVKRSSSTGNWCIVDNTRNPTNERNKFLFANEAVVEGDLSAFDTIDFTSNGFILQDTGVLSGSTNINISSSTYIYLAIA